MRINQDQEIHEAILNDAHLQALIKKREAIYNRITNVSVLKKDGKIEPVKVGGIVGSLLSKIDTLIESRMSEIENSIRI